MRALVDWTGRSLAKGRRGALPAELRPILEDLDVEVERWVGTVRDYGGLFHRVAGKVASLERKAEALGQRWLAGVRASREVFRSGGAQGHGGQLKSSLFDAVADDGPRERIAERE